MKYGTKHDFFFITSLVIKNSAEIRDCSGKKWDVGHPVFGWNIPLRGYPIIPINLVSIH